MSAIREYLNRRSMPEPNSGCQLWLGCCLNTGYGSMRRNKRHHLAHRLSWEDANGRAAPAGMDVCHKCDVPSCINPDHLFLGTRRDNMRDMARKGRAGGYSVGEDSRTAKLTEEQASAIRLDGRTQRAIARDYGISKTNVGAIKRRETWAHL